jgi:ATP-dependent RNA helicase SUPV3L1/SUV3
VNEIPVDKVIDEIRSGLSAHKEKLSKRLKLNDEQKEKLRSQEDANKVLDLLSFVKNLGKDFLSNHKAFENVFEKSFMSLEDFSDFNVLIESAFYRDEVFLNNDYYVSSIGGQFVRGVFDSYFERAQSWFKTALEKHESSQEILNKEFVNYNIEVSCRCNDCNSKLRTKVFAKFQNEIDGKISDLEEELFEDIMYKKIDAISAKVDLRLKQLERDLKKIRFHLKRASYNKLYTHLKKSWEDKFGYTSKSSLTQTYSEKVKSYLLAEVTEVKPDFFSDEDFKKFFTRLNLSIWYKASYLKREFSHYITSLLTLKRKDISSTILRNYLGQFWMYSSARRFKRTITYHMGPTNSGKTYNALQALAKSKSGCYLAPLRLLASEVFDTLESKGIPTTLLTGEEVIEREGAAHYSSTIEMAKLKEEFDCVVIDEIQMIGDSQRGWAWTRALIHMNSQDIHICGDASALELVQQILKLTGDELVINNYERKTKLKVESQGVKLEDLTKGDALIVFSRRNALKHKVELEKFGHRVSIVYGMLNPDVRREQARRFDQEETDIIVSTDAISMGMNLPVKRIVFSTFVKFINSMEYHLSDSEIKQIAGRAGRYGRFPTGFVTCVQHEKNKGKLEELEQALNCELPMREMAMLGPDLDLFLNVNEALKENALRVLKYSEFLRLFFTMEFSAPFFCVQLKEMIELAEMVEEINDQAESLGPEEIFGFSCAPVNLRQLDHVEYFRDIVTKYVHGRPIYNEMIDASSNSIDYLETAIKNLELYQWLARHFQNKFFDFESEKLLENKMDAVEKLNKLLSEKTIKYYNPYSFGKKFDKSDKKKKFKKKVSSKNEDFSNRSRNSKGKKFKSKASKLRRD